MEDNSKNQKRNLKDVSHYFISSLEETHETPAPTVASAPISRQSINTNIHLASICPLGLENFSLLLHVYFAQLYFNSPYKIYIVSANPHIDSWQYLQKDFNLPPLTDIDYSSGIKTFNLHNDVHLLITSGEYLRDFFDFSKTNDTPENAFTDDERPSLLLFDTYNTDIYLRDKMAQWLDSMLVLTPERIETLRDTYKIMKAYCGFHPHLRFGVILQGESDNELEHLIKTQFNSLTESYLQCEVLFIGFCKFATMSRGNNLHWSTQKPADNIYAIDKSFVSFSRKNEWSEELISLYQTILSNIH